MKKYHYIVLASLLAGAASCSERIETDPMTPIKFTAGIEDFKTKAFMNSADLNTANSELTIWGFEGSDVLISGKPAVYDAAGGWTLADTYYWQAEDYTFFSYLSKDKDGKDVSGISTAAIASSRQLGVNARAFDFDSDATADNTFDFCYSDVVFRNKTDNDHSPVEMSLRHLYTAIGFSAHNYSGGDITLKELTVVGLKNKKSAVIDFSDNATVTYPTTDVACTWTNSSKTLYSSATGITIAAGGEYANIVDTHSTTSQYFMFWPQTPAELAATGWTDNTTAPAGGAYLKVVYNLGSGSDITRYARFPQDNDGANDLGWPAGTKHMMQLALRGDQITIKLAALPWNYSEPTIKYDEEVEIASALQFDENTCTVDEADHKVYFKGGNPIRGSFKFVSPADATWVISKEGDYDAFEIDDTASGRYGDGIDCNFGTVDVVAGNSITLYPKNAGSGRDYSIQLSFSVRYHDGESYSIDDKIQIDDAGEPVRWTIILTK